MSEEATQETGAPKPEDGFKAITSQDELNKLIGARIGAVKNQYADYDDLKTKAAEFDKLAEANKSELQKALDAAKAADEKAAQAEAKATAAELVALRSDVAREKNVPVSALTGSTKEELEKAADTLIAWRGDKSKPKPDVKTLKSGAADDSTKPNGKAGAAAALRGLRSGGN